MRLTLSTLLLAITLAGCATEPVDREGKLLTMAAAEAQQIPDATERLTRQLNFASLQLNEGKRSESRQSLAYAAQTLRDAKPEDLKSQIRIAGWVSISQLSRAADDRATAATACDQAVEVLKTIQPVSERPEYVVGVAYEIQALHGNSAASKLLEMSGDWIKEIADQTIRRKAMEAICDFTFKCDDFQGGLAMLRADFNAAWRSDTLAMLAAKNKTPKPRGIFDGVPSFADPSEMFVNTEYGKPVDYNSVFQSHSQLQTEQK